MNNFIIEEISKELDVKIKQVETVLKLLEEGNTEYKELRELLRLNSNMVYLID